MIVSSMAEEGAEETVAALALGAADALPKPGTGRFNGRFSEVLISRLRRSAMRTTVRRTVFATPAPVLSAPLRAMSNEPIDLLAIGASTGGIHALNSFFEALPQAHRRADPRHAASARAVHAGVRPAARHCVEA